VFTLRQLLEIAPARSSAARRAGRDISTQLEWLAPLRKKPTLSASPGSEMATSRLDNDNQAWGSGQNKAREEHGEAALLFP
jgi:hypothetical protein